MKHYRFMRAFVLGILVLVGVLIAGSFSTTASQPAQAQSAKVVRVKTMNISKKATHVSQGAMYSSNRLTKMVHNGANYKGTTFYTYQQAQVTRSNKKKTAYVYIKSANGQVTGWIWKGYLKAGKATVTNVSNKKVTVQVNGPLSEGNKIIASGPVSFKTSATAFSVLQALTKRKGIKIAYTGRGSSTYVTMIAGKKAGSGGVGGGWVYQVNGHYSSRSAGAYKLKNGDKVQWAWSEKAGDRGWQG